MKMFSRHKTYEEIKAQCEVQGIPFNDYLYRHEGWDTVVVNSIYGSGHFPGHVVYNVVNGSFFGETPAGVGFESSSTRHEGRLWFKALLDFFYVA